MQNEELGVLVSVAAAAGGASVLPMVQVNWPEKSHNRDGKRQKLANAEQHKHYPGLGYRIQTTWRDFDTPNFAIMAPQNTPGVHKAWSLVRHSNLKLYILNFLIYLSGWIL